MDARTLSRMASLLRVATGAAGMDPADVVAGPQSVGIVGTGVDVTWSADAQGRGRPGWQVRTTYHVANIAHASTAHMATDIIAAYSPREEYQAVRQAVIAVIQRRIEAALEGIV